MVALNYPLTGKMGTVGSIDNMCWRQSRRAGLVGTFRAFLSSRLQDSKFIVKSDFRNHPVGNLKVRRMFVG